MYKESWNVSIRWHYTHGTIWALTGLKTTEQLERLLNINRLCLDFHFTAFSIISNVVKYYISSFSVKRNILRTALLIQCLKSWNKKHLNSNVVFLKKWEAYFRGSHLLNIFWVEIRKSECWRRDSIQGNLRPKLNNTLCYLTNDVIKQKDK